MTFVDLHCDTITSIMSKNEALYENTGHIDIKRLLKYECPVQTFAVCLDGKGTYQEAEAAIKFFLSELKSNGAYIRLAKNGNDIAENKKCGLISAVLAIEGGEVLEGDAGNIQKLFDLGVRIFTLTWNTKNELGFGALSENLGLTTFGKQAVRLLNELGIIVDVSHLSERGFWDVAACSNVPFIASHSNCAALCPNPRNLTDSQIKTIAERSSVIGVNFYPLFLTGSEQAGLDDILAHIKHIVYIGGIDTPALGSDFDGVKLLPGGVNGVSFHEMLFDALYMAYGQSGAEKIIEKNVLRIL